MRKAIKLGQHDPVDSCEGVVGQHRRNCDREPGSGHDQCFADRAGHLVDHDLAG